MDVKKLIIGFLFLINILALGYFLWQKFIPENKVAVTEAPPVKNVIELKKPPVKKIEVKKGEAEMAENSRDAHVIPDGVNESFHDSPETQMAWIARGEGIIIKKFPGADSAEIQNSFFHRGHLNYPVACGEARFLSNGKVLEDFQRYIFAGVEIVYYESKIKNYQRLWEMMCVQTFEE